MEVENKGVMLVIINKRSRRGAGSEVENIFKILRDNKLFLIVCYPESKAQVRDILNKHHKNIDAVLVGGGDGTLHLVAEYLVSYALPIGILPLGTANDLARTLGIPNDLEAAARIIIEGKLQPINVGLVNKKIFLNVANIGLGVEVGRELSGAIKKKLGILSYAKGLFSAFRRRKSFRVVVEYENSRRLKLKSMQVAVGNGKFYGGGIAISEDADIKKHGLVFSSLEPRSFLQAVILSPLIKLGKIQDVEGVTLLRSDEFRVTTVRPMSISADGEIVSKTPANFGFLPSAIKVYVPEA